MTCRCRYSLKTGRFKRCRLHAAAREMLEVLETLLTGMSTHDIQYRMVEQAIAKAKAEFKP